jgi:hypothetical protein
MRPGQERLENLASLASKQEARNPGVLLTHLPFVLIEALDRRTQYRQIDVDQ